MPRREDPVRRAVLDAARNGLRAIEGQVVDGGTVEVLVVDRNIIMVSLRHRPGGPRFFQFKLSETWS